MNDISYIFIYQGAAQLHFIPLRGSILYCNPSFLHWIKELYYCEIAKGKTELLNLYSEWRVFIHVILQVLLYF